MPLRMWRCSDATSGPRDARGNAQLRLSPAGIGIKEASDARGHASRSSMAGVQHLAGHVESLPRSEKPVIQKLRWARHHGVQAVAQQLRRVYPRHGTQASARALNRAQGQRRPLRSAQLRVGDTAGTATQSAQFSPRLSGLGLLIFSTLLIAIPVAAQTTQTRVPTSQTATQTWQTAGTYTDVDDPVGAPDDDTTYILADGDGGGSGTFARFAYATPTVPAGSTSISVRVILRAKVTTGTVASALRVLVNSTTYTASAHDLTGSYVDYSDTWATNPNTAAAWTVDDVNGSGAAPLQEIAFSASGIGAAEDARFTQFYLEITYTPSAGGHRRAFFFGVF